MAAVGARSRRLYEVVDIAAELVSKLHLSA
jgi:hypothetical protein